MKQLLTFLCALLFALAGKAAPAGDELKQLLAEARAIVNTAGNAADREVSRALSEARRAVNATDRQIDRAMAEARRAVGASDREIDRAIAEARAAIDAAETAAVANQSIEELNKAAREQVVRELGLTSRQRKEFEPLYKAYREALDKAVNTPAAERTRPHNGRGSKPSSRTSPPRRRSNATTWTNSPLCSLPSRSAASTTRRAKSAPTSNVPPSTAAATRTRG